ncbi:MAG TPA: NUDIX domain-containing protein [Propionibacteriaceae bacterium]|nr:NUDIX domain-containing protein [Propionibacteriaceae bacterium]
MYATCGHGHRHWGLAGAAGALVVAPDSRGPRLLLTLRSAEVHHGLTWSVPGGAIDPGDVDAYGAACRELHEELDYDASGLPVLGWHRFECGGWTYATVLLAAPAPVPLSAHGWETDEVCWLGVPEVDRLAAQQTLHPGFASSWPELREVVLNRAA